MPLLLNIFRFSTGSFEYAAQNEQQIFFLSHGRNKSTTASNMASYLYLCL